MEDIFMKNEGLLGETFGGTGVTPEQMEKYIRLTDEELETVAGGTEGTPVTSFAKARSCVNFVKKDSGQGTSCYNCIHVLADTQGGGTVYYCTSVWDWK
jgi:hypothetical protein